ncbi:MAG TPA: MlaA family lipoprotein [Candidatus Azoamicus sp.]
MRFFCFLVLFYFCFSKLPDIKIDDSFNRRTYAFNRGFDKSFLNPILTIYIKVCPSFLDKNFDSFFKTMTEFNNVFFLFIAANFQEIVNNFYRFFLNFYFGFFGFFDFASFYNKNYINFDFQTYLFYSGFKDIVYFVTPIVGPSTLHFNFGLMLSNFINPFFYFFDYLFFYYFLEILNKKSVVFFDVNFFHNVMLDGYIFLKDIYIQNLESIFHFDVDNFLVDPPD